MKSVTIGITENEKINDYISYINECSDIPVKTIVLRYQVEDSANELKKNLAILPTLDAIVFTGGDDFCSAKINRELTPEMIKQYHLTIDEKRDAMEWEIAKKSLELNIPIFGICRGMQLMNLVLGGDNYLDIIVERASEIVHKAHPDRRSRMHDIEITPATKLYELMASGSTICVNSRHHQAVKIPASSVRVSAISDDGIIEGIEFKKAKELFIGVQWHPERLWLEGTAEQKTHSKQLIASFIASVLKI